MVACDGIEAIRKAMTANLMFNSLSNHFNLISAIDHRLEKSLLEWYWRHVKGHQDNHVGPLDRWASLNVECNTAAKERWAANARNWASQYCP